MIQFLLVLFFFDTALYKTGLNLDLIEVHVISHAQFSFSAKDSKHLSSSAFCLYFSLPLMFRIAALV